MALVFFRSLERMKGGRNESTSAGGVSGSLRQNRCFAAHSPALPDPNNLLHFFIFCVAMAELILTARVDSFREQGSKKGNSPLQPSFPNLLLLIIASQWETFLHVGILRQKILWLETQEGVC